MHLALLSLLALSCGCSLLLDGGEGIGRGDSGNGGPVPTRGPPQSAHDDDVDELSWSQAVREDGDTSLFVLVAVRGPNQEFNVFVDTEMVESESQCSETTDADARTVGLYAWDWVHTGSGQTQVEIDLEASGNIDAWIGISVALQPEGVVLAASNNQTGTQNESYSLEIPSETGDLALAGFTWGAGFEGREFSSDLEPVALVLEDADGVPNDGLQLALFERVATGSSVVLDPVFTSAKPLRSWVACGATFRAGPQAVQSP